MADIVPELWEKIHSDFESKTRKSEKINNFRTKTIRKKAASEDVAFYSAEIGRCAAEALAENLTADNLPGGKLYWNIAERTIKELLKEVHTMVMNAAVNVQRIEDAKAGINIKAIESEFPESRINGFLNKLISILEEESNE